MEQQRFIKPKLTKYLQLYSKNAITETKENKYVVDVRVHIGGNLYTNGNIDLIFSNPNTGSSNKTAVGELFVEGGVAKYADIKYRGFNYTSAPSVSVAGLPDSVTEGLNPVLYSTLTSNTKYTWQLATPIDIDENAKISIVQKRFENLNRYYYNQELVIRLVDVSTKTAVSTKNVSGNNHSIPNGHILDVFKYNDDSNNDFSNIELELENQQLNSISLTLNHGLYDTDGVSEFLDFMIVMKIEEKEPDILEYGSLNNINMNQY